VEEGKVVQYWYDDPRSLSLKAAYAGVSGWRGVGTWNIDCLDYTSTDPLIQEDTRRMWEALDAFKIGGRSGDL